MLGACSSPTSQSTAPTAQTAANTAVTAVRDASATATASATAPAVSIKPQTAMPDISSPESALKSALEQNILYMGPFTPYTGSKARIYGSTANGCIAGAASLSDKGEDFQLQRWGRNRHYAHPLMLQYLADLRARTAQFDLPPLVIGDLSQPAGGPYAYSNHSSHNTGLDVDLPFIFAQPRLSAAELNNPRDNYIVQGQKVRESFTPEIATYIKLAASDPRVDRIFVAPMIKKHMCALYEQDEYNGFLRKLRPWFGHRAHMHVRLNCPSDSPECVLPQPIPEGTGCGYEVDSWFLPPPPKSQQVAAKPKPKKELLAQCPLILLQYQQQ